MWCRYCGSTTTSRWRPSPWGKNKLCNAHWKKWHESKLDLNIKEPTSPICRLKNNEFLFRERTKKRKRSSSVTEDELEGKITLLFYIRKKIQEVEQMFHSLQIALKKDFFLSLQLFKEKVTKLFSTYQEACVQKNDLRKKHLENYLQILFTLNQNVDPTPFNLIQEHDQLKQLIQTILAKETFVSESKEKKNSFENEIVPSDIPLKTNRKLGFALSAIDMEIQLTKNNLFLWWKEKFSLLSLQNLQLYAKERGKYSHWIQTQQTLWAKNLELIDQLWWRNPQQSSLPKGFEDLPDILDENKLLNVAHLQKVVKPCPLWAFNEEGGHHLYQKQEKRLLSFSSLQDLQNTASFYLRAKENPFIQPMDFIFVWKGMGYMVCPYLRGQAFNFQTPIDRNVMWNQFLQSMISLHRKGIRHGEICLENLFILEDGQLIIRREKKAPPQFSPPFDKNNISGQKDVWAVGVLLYYLHHQKFPLLQEKETYIPFYLENLALSSIGEQMLQVDPQKRLILGQQKEGFALCNSGKDTLFKLHNNNDLGCHKTILSFVLEHIRNLRRINWSRGTYQILKKEVLPLLFAIFAGFGDLENETFNYKLNFQYHQEEGEGSGVTKDVYTNFFKECLLHGLLVVLPGGDVFVANSNCTKCKKCPFHTENHYFLLGRIFAKMIFDEITLPFNLSIVWVRFMCNKKIMVEDMKTWDDQFYRMCFLYQKEKNIAQFELKWKKALVTNNNLFSYIEFKIQEEIDQYIPPKCLLAMKKGFLQSSMIQKILKILTVKQTQQLLNGISCFCPQKLLTFVKWKPSLLKHPIQKFFLQWIQTAPLTKFLQWSTGCPHLPLQKFSLTIGLDPLKKYPTAHTCFNQVNLCPSPNYEDFQNKMELALQTQAFFLK